MKQTNFDRYLKEQLADPTFARRFEQAGQAWDVALQIATLRRQAGLSQKQLAERAKTSQQQICRLESPGYDIVRNGARRRTGSHDHGAPKSRGTDLVGDNEILTYSTHFSSGSIASPTIPRRRGR